MPGPKSPGLRSKVMRFSGAAARGYDASRKEGEKRSKLVAAEDEKTRLADQQGVMSDRMGKYAQAIQVQDQQETDRIFNEIMNDRNVEAAPKQDFAKYHRQVKEKLENPPHKSGMTQKELIAFEQDNNRMGRKGTWNEVTQSFDYTRLDPSEMSQAAQTKIEYEAARAAEIRDKLKKAKAVNPKTVKDIAPWEKEFNDEYRKRYIDKDGDPREGAPNQDDWVDERVLMRLERLNLNDDADEERRRQSVLSGAPQSSMHGPPIVAEYRETIDALMVGKEEEKDAQGNITQPAIPGMTREEAEAAALSVLTPDERQLIENSQNNPSVGPQGPQLVGAPPGQAAAPPPPAPTLQPAPAVATPNPAAPVTPEPTATAPPAPAPMATPPPAPMAPRPTLEAAPIAEAAPDSIPDAYPREQEMPEAPVSNVPDDVPVPSADMIEGPTAPQEVITEVDDAMLALSETLPDETSVAELVQGEIDRYEQEGKPEHAQYLREVYGSFLVEGGDRTLVN